MAVKKLYKESVIIVKLLKESVSFAFVQLKGDKFRTFLSLFGVSIGIFSIVAIFTAIDALQDNVKKGFDSFSSDVIQVSKFPIGNEDENGEVIMDGNDYKWWEYIKRPSNTYEECKFLKKNSKMADAVALSVFFNSTLKNGRNSVSGAMVGSVTYDFSKIAKANLEKGRYFTQEEDKDGAPIVIIGYEIAQKLFKDDNPIGKRIKIRSTSAEVIGVFEKQGESMVNVFQTDESVLIPLNFGRYMVNIKMVDNSIFVTPKAGVKQQDLVDEITNLMRAQRRLKPNEKNDFSIIKMTFLLDMVQSVFSILNLVGWVIAGFSLLIGGFGIANIMFVSVKERTNIIGIQKALGAKKYVIMTQFLVEAAFLAIAGGLIGIIMVSGVIFAVPANAQFTMQLSLANIINGVAIASIIGLISGLIPAWLAATLNPVDAINSK